MCHCPLSKFIFLLCCSPPGSCLPPTGSCPSSRQPLLYSLVSCFPVLSFLPLITAFLSLSWPPSSFKYFTHIYNYKHTYIHLCVHIYVCIHNIYYICVWGCVYMCLYMYICVLLCDLKSTFYTWEKMWCLVFWVWHILPHLPISSSIHFPANVTTVLWREFHCPHSDLFLALPLSIPSSCRAKTLLDASEDAISETGQPLAHGSSSLPPCHSLNMATVLVAPSLGLHVYFQASSLNTASISRERLSDTLHFS